MRNAFAMLALGLAAAGCASAPESARPAPAAPAAAAAGPAPAAVALKNPDFSAPVRPDRACPTQWWCTAHSDPSAYRFGLESDPKTGNHWVRVERVKNEPWALVSQMLAAEPLVGKRLRLSVAVDAAQVEGAGAGPMLHVQDGYGATLSHEQRLQARQGGWHTVSVELDVVAGASLIGVNLAFEGGGVARFDDVRLEVVGPARGRP